MPADVEKKLILLQDKMDTHIEEHRRCAVNERRRWDRLIVITEANAKCIHDLTEATEGVIDAWRTGTNLGKFVKWLSGFAIIGGAITWLIKHFGGH